MANEWTDATVGDVFDLVNGYAFKSAEFLKQGVPVIKIKNVKAGEFSEHEFSYVSEDFIRNRANKLAQFGDLLISMSGNRHDGSPETWVGKIAQFRKSENYFINQRVGALRVKTGAEIDARFASFVLSSISYQELFIAIATSSGGQANLSPTQILGAPILYPSRLEQRRIAHVLGTLDDKIENNRKTAKTLEAMAQAIFKSWFVDFDPVRAKMAGESPESICKRLKLTPEILDLFPDRLVDSELGEIPEGWEITTLTAMSTLNPESLTKAARPKLINYVDLSNTKWGRIESVTIYTQEDAPSRAQRILRPDDTIVGTVRPGNGSFALITENGLTGSTGFAVLRPKKTIYAAFVYLAVTAKENIQSLVHLADGGAYPAVRPEVVAATQVVKPCDESLATFSTLTSVLIRKFATIERQIRTLVALRDALLPKLISGEIRIQEAVKTTEEVLS